MCPVFDVVHAAFPLQTKASPILQGAVKDGAGEAVVACDMLVSSQLPRKMVQVGDAEKIPHSLTVLKESIQESAKQR